MSSFARFLSDDELLQIRQLYLESLENEDDGKPIVPPVGGAQAGDDSPAPDPSS
jgi:hypothetical protein